MNLKHKKIDLSGLDIEIDIEAAKGFIDHRIEKKSPATQRIFDNQMKMALRAHECGMTPTELIDFTCNKGWTAININYTQSAVNREMQALSEIRGTHDDTQWNRNGINQRDVLSPNNDTHRLESGSRSDPRECNTSVQRFIPAGAENGDDRDGNKQRSDDTKWDQ